MTQNDEFQVQTLGGVNRQVVVCRPDGSDEQAIFPWSQKGRAFKLAAKLNKSI